MKGLLPILLLGGAAVWFLSQQPKTAKATTKKVETFKPAEIFAQKTVAPKTSKVATAAKKIVAKAKKK